MSSFCFFRNECFSSLSKSLSAFQIHTLLPANPAVMRHLENTQSLVVLKNCAIILFGVLFFWNIPYKEQECTQLSLIGTTYLKAPSSVALHSPLWIYISLFILEVSIKFAEAIFFPYGNKQRDFNTFSFFPTYLCNFGLALGIFIPQVI